MSENPEKVAEFIELRSPQDRLPMACERATLHFERGQSVAIHCPDPAEAAELDGMLWRLRQNSFVPHVRLEEAEADPIEPVVVFSSTGGPPSDVLILAGAEELPPWVERYAHVYDFAAVYDEELRRLSRRRFARLKEAGYRMRFIRP